MADYSLYTITWPNGGPNRGEWVNRKAEYSNKVLDLLNFCTLKNLERF